VKLTTHLHLVPGTRTRETIPPLPQYVFSQAQGMLYLLPLPSISLSVFVLFFGRRNCRFWIQL